MREHAGLEPNPTELEFVAALKAYLKDQKKEHADWSDVLKVLDGLGYGPKE